MSRTTKYSSLVQCKVTDAFYAELQEIAVSEQVTLSEAVRRWLAEMLKTRRAETKNRTSTVEQGIEIKTQ